MQFLETPIIGHEAQRAALLAARERGRLAHALCFVGPERVGKRAVADWLARELLQTKELLLHPDFVLIERLRDETTDALEHEISVDRIRLLREQLSQKSFFSGPKVAVIDGAEHLSVAATNALLKTLEEPPGNTTIILITPSLEWLLPTILSRVQVMRFGFVSDGAMLAGGISQAHVDAAHGRPGVAVALQDPEYYEAFAAEAAECRELLLAPIWKRAKLIEGWFGKKQSHADGIAALRERMVVWRGMLRDSLLAEHGAGKVGNRELALAGLVGDNIPHAHTMLLKLDRLEELVAMNANVRYALEATFLT